MNTIDINNKYRFAKLDDLNWAIQEGKVIKESKNPELIGTTRWENISYHLDLAQACTRLAKTLTDESLCDTLQDYSDTLKRHCDALAATVRTA